MAKFVRLGSLPATTKEDEGKILEVDKTGVFALSETLIEVKDTLNDITYEDLEIKSFINDVGVAEKGETINEVTLEWETSKEPVSLTLNDVAIDKTATSETKTNLGLKSDKTWTLKAKGAEGEVSTASTSISFLNGVYYGAASRPTAYNSDFILGLTGKTLSRRKLSSFNVNATSGLYIYYCLPVSMGECTFKFDNNVVRFYKDATISFTNSHGYTESYNIYRSINAGLGNTTLNVS